MVEFFVRRPVTTWMLTLSFILLGLYSLKLIPVDRLPDVEFPVVTVNTVYPGASPEVVDANVTRVIEEEVSTISGIEAIYSSSYAGVSVVTITFSLEKDVDVAAQEVRDAVERAYRRMPPGVEPPLVRKTDTSSTPILAFYLYSDALPYETLAYLAEEVLKKELERVNGVGEVTLGGFTEMVLLVEPDPFALYARGLSVLELVNALKKNHFEAPAGLITGREKEYTLRFFGKARTERGIERIYVLKDVRLGELARVSFELDERRSASRFKGKTAVGLVVYKQAKTNTVEVADAVKRKVRELKKLLPPGVDVDYTFDASTFIKESVRAAGEEIVVGSLLTAFTVYAFLGSLRLTLVPVSAIPVALLGTVFALYMLGMSLNMITLLAMAVAVGIVIDDAIVVLESIYRRRQEGRPPLEAGVEGTRVVMFALLASTASLIVVFLPILFLRGVLGEFLRNFALTLVLAIAVSYLVSVTFTPMAASRLVTAEPSENLFMRLYARFERLFDRLLKLALNRKGWVVALSLLNVVAGVYFYKHTKKEFFPTTDEGRLIVRFETPVGSSFEFTDAKAREIERVLNASPYVKKFGLSVGEGLGGVGVNRGIVFVYLVERDRRPHVLKVMEELRKEFAKIKDVKVSVETPFAVAHGRGRSSDIQFVVRGESLEVLERIAQKMVEEFSRAEGFRDVDTDLRLNAPQVKLSVDRDKLGELGVDAQTVADVLNALFGRLVVGTYELGAKSYDLIVRAPKSFRSTPESLKKVFVRNKEGKLVPLSELVKVELGSGYFSLNRYNRQYSFTFYANVAGIDLATAKEKVEAWLKRNLPLGYSYEATGQVREFRKAFRGFVFSIIAAVVGVYMVLASLFESLKHPFTVLLMVPLAVPGTFGLMALTGVSLSVPAYFGIILLIGIVVRDAVLFIERIIQLKEEGLPVREAIMQARKERLRPILMTTLTVIASLVPVALGLTAGSEQRRPLAVAVIGGLITALPLSLFLLPVLYELFEKGLNLKYVKRS
ncbi:MAG: efflux RND transporter permease subunit [Aquificae bacterium]|nr:efflux RND transporter permease subunit [Aquificota bacterium]